MSQAAPRASVYAPLNVLVYGSDAVTRKRIQLTIGEFPAAGLAPLRFVEAATVAGLLTEIDTGTIDLVILDGEASPYGGIGVAKQIKDEQLHYLPTIVVVGRSEDTWLARWSRADAVVVHPLDPTELTTAAVGLLRHRMVG